MNTERLQKASATRAANKDIYANQSIKVGEWKVYRVDEYNWGIKKSGMADPWFYGRLIHALQDLPHKMLQDGPKKTLEAILDQQKQIRKEIAAMFNMKFDHFKPTDGEKG